MTDSAQQLKKWFAQHQRDLLFRQDRNPYFVWISEVMLQQTRVEVVKPYFAKWIVAFPTIEALASAPLEEVIKLWEGLGYYARARNLHKAAQYICAHHKGFIPDDLDQLLAIPGIGPYTARAILSFSFLKNTAPVDGNVVRVLTRFFGISSRIDKKKTQDEIQQKADTFLPDQDPHLVAEGLIELGALLCTKDKPRCYKCPLKENCFAHQNEQTHLFPHKKKKEPAILLEKTALVLHFQGMIALIKHTEGLMQDLHEFPLKESLSQSHLGALAESTLDVKELPTQKASFTKYKLNLHALFYELKEPFIYPDLQYHPIEVLFDLPFSSGHRRLCHHLKEYQLTAAKDL